MNAMQPSSKLWVKQACFSLPYDLYHTEQGSSLGSQPTVLSGCHFRSRRDSSASAASIFLKCMEGNINGGSNTANIRIERMYDSG